MPAPHPLVAVALLAAVSTVSAQVQPGDIALTGFSTTSFAVAAANGTTIYNTGGFQGSVSPGTSQAILHDPVQPNSFIVGGFGFVGRATITGPGSVVYAPISTAINTAAQMSWDFAGNIVVADAGVDQVRLVTPAGTVVDLSIGAQPWGTTLNAGAFETSTGDVIVGNSGGLHRLPLGSQTGVPIVAGLGGFVSGITFDPCNGDILATVLTSNRIVRVLPGGFVVDEVTPGTVSAPNSIDVDVDGNYIIGGPNAAVFRVVPGGGAVLIAQAATLGSSASGVAYVGGRACPFGSACPAPSGLPALTAAPFRAGALLVTRSNNHAPGALGLSVYSLAPLAPPLDLGLLFGAAGCQLYVGPDVLGAGLTDANGLFVDPVPTSLAFLNQQLFVQHVVLEAGTLASLSASNALRLRF